MRGLGKVLVGIGFVVLLLTCATRDGRYGKPSNAQHRTLSVFNETGSHVHVYVGGHKVGVATGGENCLTLRGVSTGQQYLSVRVGRQRIRTMTPEDFSYTDWTMTLQRRRPQDLKFDLLSLQPAPRCRD